MSFQKCPVCNGLGKTQDTVREILEISICHACKGSGIINEQTGLPPENNTRKTTKEEMDLYKLNESKLYHKPGIHRNVVGHKAGVFISNSTKDETKNNK